LLTVGVGGSLLILPFALWVARERRGTAALESIDAVDAAAEGDDDMDLRAAIRTRSFWVLGFALAGFFFYMVGVLDHFIASLTDRGLSSAEAGAYLGSAIGMGIFSKVVMGIVADRISPLPAIWTDYGLYAASSVVLIFVPDEPYLKAFVVLFGFSYAARDVVYPMAIAECFGVRYLAAIYGALMIVLAPAGSAGQIFAAHCFERFGSYDVAFEVFALVNVVVFASLFLLRPEKELARG
jgi:MFS family permease